MKIQIRRGVFETNSSSVHSLTICTEAEYNAWARGEVYFDKWNECFITKDKIPESFKNANYETEEDLEIALREDGICTIDNFNDDYFEYFEQTYTTPGGEKIIAFGYSGYDG